MGDNLIADISLMVSGIAMVISGWNVEDARPRLAPIVMALGFIAALAGLSLVTWRLATGAY